jgi:hypothetical protein
MVTKLVRWLPLLLPIGTAVTVAATGREQGYSETENLLVSKAYISASEDLIKGNYQKARAITEKVYANFLALCVEQTMLNYLDVAKMTRNAHRGTKHIAKPSPDALALEGLLELPTNMYKTRLATAVWGQFKTKITNDCMAYGGIIAMHPALLGDVDTRARWLPLYKSREGSDFKYENCIVYCSVVTLV